MKKARELFNKARAKVIKRKRLVKAADTFGFALIVLASSIVWVPKLIWQMGIIITDNIRDHYTDNDDIDED